MRNLYVCRCSNINLQCLGNQRNLQELRLKSVSGIHLTTTLAALKQLSSLKHLVCIILCRTHISTECHSVVITCHCLYICQGVSHAQNAKNAIQYKHTLIGLTFLLAFKALCHDQTLFSLQTVSVFQ